MPKVGDRIRTKNGDDIFYSEGSVAILTMCDADGYCWADLEQPENEPGSFDPDCDATWCVGNADMFDVIQ